MFFDEDDLLVHADDAGHAMGLGQEDPMGHDTNDLLDSDPFDFHSLLKDLDFTDEEMNHIRELTLDPDDIDDTDDLPDTEPDDDNSHGISFGSGSSSCNDSCWNTCAGTCSGSCIARDY